MAADLVKSAESIVIGKDPADVNVILKELYSCYNLNHLHMHAANWAVNSIERACWDIMGQKAGLPLYKLWGGGFRKEVEVFGFIEAEDLDEIRKVSKLRAEQGYKVIYTKVGFSTPEYDVAMVKAIREGAPDPSIKIRVDANQAWNVGEAISIINQMEPYGIDCVDQPVIMYNLDALKDVKNATHVPIAAHESTWTMYDMFLIFSVTILSRMYIDAGLPNKVFTLLSSITSSKFLMLVFINIFLVIIGMLMDDASGIVLAAPLLTPIIQQMGIDMVHFAAIIGVNLGMGGITPPTAPMTYLAGKLGGGDFTEMLWPTLKLIIFGWLPVLVITTYWESFSLFLPRLILGY